MVDKNIDLSIRIESCNFTPDDIAKIEDHYNARYVCDGDLNENDVLMPIPCSLFYCDTPHEVSKSHYFVLYYHPIDRGLRIASGQKIADTTIVGVVAEDGEVIYSRHRHDYQVSKDGTAWIDGGQTYTRTSFFFSRADLAVEKDKLVIKEHF